MKKILFSGLLLSLVTGLFSQDLKKAKSYLDSKELDKAKTEIDAYVEKNPDNAEGNYVKSKVYGSLASSDQFKNTAPDARATAFEAFKKSVDADKDNKLMLVMVKDQYKPIIDLYSGYYEAGIKDFNSAAASKDKAEFTKAMNDFKSANMVGQYIYSKKWALSNIDTALVLNIGKAALNAGDTVQTLASFKMLADSSISGTRDGNEGYQLPYQWLAMHYRQAGDDANFNKYTELGKKYFPKDDYYDAVMLDYYRDKKDQDALFKKYDEIVTKYPDSLSYHFNYANETFNYLYNSDAGTKISDKDARLKTVEAELQKSLALKPDDVNTNWLYGQYYYNGGVDLKEKANATKGTKPEDVKAKADLNAQAKASFTKAIPYVEKALSSLESGYKKADKSKYKSVADLMQRTYQGLNQPDKVKAYEKMYDNADTKFVN